MYNKELLMKSCLNSIFTLLAALCAILFVLVASLSLWVFVSERMLVSASTYKQAMRNQNIYNRLPALIAGEIVYQDQHNTSGKGLPPELKRLSQANWQTLITDLTTPESLQVQAESVIDQFIAYLNSSNATFQPKISLADFKQKLQTQAGYDAVLQIINAQPVCTTQDWEKIVNDVQTAQFENLPFCRPPAEMLALAEPYIRAALNDLTPAIPDSLTLANQSEPLTAQQRTDFQRVQRGIWLSLCLPVALLVLVVVFGVRSLSGCGFWLGVPLLLTGLGTIVAAVVTWSLPGYMFSHTASGRVTITGLSPDLTQAVVDVGTSIVHTLARTVGILGGVAAVAGIGILAAGLLFGAVSRPSRL